MPSSTFSNRWSNISFTLATKWVIGSVEVAGMLKRTSHCVPRVLKRLYSLVFFHYFKFLLLHISTLLLNFKFLLRHAHSSLIASSAVAYWVGGRGLRALVIFGRWNHRSQIITGAYPMTFHDGTPSVRINRGGQSDSRSRYDVFIRHPSAQLLVICSSDYFRWITKVCVRHFTFVINILPYDMTSDWLETRGSLQIWSLILNFKWQRRGARSRSVL